MYYWTCGVPYHLPSVLINLWENAKGKIISSWLRGGTFGISFLLNACSPWNLFDHRGRQTSTLVSVVWYWQATQDKCVVGLLFVGLVGLFFKTSLYVCLSFPTWENKMKRDSELLQSWVLQDGLGLCIWPGTKDATVVFPPTLLTNFNVLFSTPPQPLQKSIVAGLKLNLFVGIVLGNIPEFWAQQRSQM